MELISRDPELQRSIARVAASTVGSFLSLDLKRTTDADVRSLRDAAFVLNGPVIAAAAEPLMLHGEDGGPGLLQQLLQFARQPLPAGLALVDTDTAQHAMQLRVRASGAAAMCLSQLLRLQWLSTGLICRRRCHATSRPHSC